LSGGFGEVRLGRQYVPAFYVGLNSDPWAYDYNVAGAGSFTRGGNPVSRANNQVTYRTPDIAGLTAEVAVAAGEGVNTQVPADARYGRNMGFNVQYNAGPLWAGLGYNKQKTVAPGAPDNDFWVIGAAYDLGVVRPIVSYSRGHNSQAATATTAFNAKSTAYLIGATAPVGPGRLKAVVARLDPAGPNNNTTKVGVGYEYALSKRTSVHADVGTAKTQVLTRATGVEAGIKHVF
jgi:predicted porin